MEKCHLRNHELFGFKMSTISEVEPHRKFQEFHSHMTYMSYIHLSGGGHSGLWGCHRQLVIAFFFLLLKSGDVGMLGQ